MEFTILKSMYYTKKCSIKRGKFLILWVYYTEVVRYNFQFFSSFNWKRTAPNPLSEASTVRKNGCFVFGIVSSVSEMRDIFNF